MVWFHPHLPSVWLGLVPPESFVFWGAGDSWADVTGHRGSSLGWRNQVCKDLAWSRATGVPLASLGYWRHACLLSTGSEKGRGGREAVLGGQVGVRGAHVRLGLPGAAGLHHFL